MNRFKVGDIVLSEDNHVTRYRILKVNKFSYDVESMDIKGNNKNHNKIFPGQDMELFSRAPSDWKAPNES